MVQLSHPYVIARKTIALTRQTFVGKVISLLFNTMSRFVIAFLPRSKHLLISCSSHSLQWFWSSRKFKKCKHFFPIYLPWSHRTRWRRQWQPTQVLLPGKSHEWRSLVGCSPWGRWGQTQLSDFTFTFHFHALEKEMATHSSVCPWRIPGTGEPGGLPSRGRTESDMTEVT